MASPTPEHAPAWQYRLPLVVQPTAIDELGHVNNAVYVQYVELAARAHSEAAGYDTDAFIASGGVFVVRRHEITYFAPAHTGDEIEARTRVELMKGPRAIRQVDLYRGEERLVEAHTEWVYIHPVTRVPKRIPPEMINAFQATTE